MSNNRGATMIEMIGVLVIIGALSAGGIAGYTKALHQNKVNKSIEQIGVISGHLSTIGANGGFYTGMSNKSAIKLKAVLPEMTISGSSSSLKNPFGGDVVISSAKLLSDGGDDQAYSIKYSGLDKQACLALATNDWGSAKSSSFIGIVAGPSASLNTDSLYLKCPGQKATLTSVVGCNNGKTLGIPIPVSEAATICSTCGNSCAVALKYY